MRIRHALYATGAAVALVTALGISPAQAATSATGYARCPVNKMCLFTGPNGSGAIAIYSNGDVNMGDNVGPRGMNDNVESMMNRTGSRWAFYTGTKYTGTKYVGGPGGGANVVTALKNKMSSLKRL